MTFLFLVFKIIKKFWQKSFEIHMILMLPLCFSNNLAFIIVEIAVNMQVPHSAGRENFSWFCCLKINLLLPHAYVCHLSPFSQVQRGLPRSPLWPIFAENRLNLVRSKYVKCFSYIFNPCWRLFLLCEMTLCLLSESILQSTAVACREQCCFCRQDKSASSSLCSYKTAGAAAGQPGRGVAALWFGVILSLLKAKIFMLLYFWLKNK